MANLNEKIEIANNLAVVELLRQPEISYEWVQEIAETVGIENTSENIAKLEETITETYLQLAFTFIDKLPTDVQETYRS